MEDNTTSGKNSNNSANANNVNNVPIMDVIFMTLRHWPWILLSVFICVGAAYLYLLKTPSIVSRTAEIQIKDETKGNSVDTQGLSDLGLFQSKTNVQNEILNLKSKDLTEEVVKSLGLDVNYYHKGKFRNIVVYGTEQPVKLVLADVAPEERFSFDLTVSGDGKVKIEDMEIGPDDETLSTTFTGALNDTITTPVGKMIVTPGPAYTKGEKVELLIKKIPLRAARDIYNSQLNVAMSDEKSSVIRLTVSDESVQRADDFLSALIGAYNESWLRDRNQIAISTSNFINERLGVIESELGNVDSDISSYKSANLVPNVDAAASMYMSQSQQTEQQILELNNQLQMTRYIRSYLANGSADQLLPANSGISNANIGSLISEYNTKLLQRNNLASKSSDSNPLVVQLDDQLKAERQVIIRTVDNEITNLNAQIKSLKNTEAQLVSRIASNPTQAKNLLSVERQQKVKESLYLFLLQKREENELSQAFTAYNTRIVNRPGASGVPPTPNKRNILAISFLLGLAIPFGITYLSEMTNTKVRGRKDLENMTPPLLGEIPQYMPVDKLKLKGNDISSREILVKPKSRNIINEAFRVLRTNVEFSRVNKDGCNIIAITSFNPGSGKSFITMNLGAALSIKNKKVLVIDGDMRHGSSSNYLDKTDVGLADYLSGETDDVKSMLVSPEDIPAMKVLTIGTMPPNPTELLESPRFGALLEQLRPYFDYIIIDCPPIEVVADAQIIDQFADRTIFVVRAGLLERTMLPELDRLYGEKKYKHIAVILNGTQSSRGRYGYGHSYRYGYGYGYGYGYHYGSDKKNSKK
ncbi:MAG: polysaccharide biosynthesis tyrosine autokinase [Lachnoclostridium sp.]|nr:polysaccharide biosynthesis tyrosine autokinase [Lachnoclostridium sp.]